MKNENDNEIKPTFETSLCALLLESSRRYSVLADAVFGFSVEQSNFANKISGQRMTLAKVVVQKQIDFLITLEEEALEIYQSLGSMDITLDLWEDCLSFDKIIQLIIENNDKAKWESALLGLQETIKKGEVFIKEIKSGRNKAKYWQCQSCGAIYTSLQDCQECGGRSNWLVDLR